MQTFLFFLASINYDYDLYNALFKQYNKEIPDLEKIELNKAIAVLEKFATWGASQPYSSDDDEAEEDQDDAPDVVLSDDYDD
jgi:hypothetical protein